uniref:Homologous-pairing protein 2 winged helix domain-containing protein n=1 Tax=Parascaris univalens TaxID=6257 RepID=A0A915A5Y2_PARUN
MEKCKNEEEANRAAVNMNDKRDAEQRYRSLDALFRKRKRIAEEMISVIHENCPLQKKALLEEMGIEVD